MAASTLLLRLRCSAGQQGVASRFNFGQCCPVANDDDHIAFLQLIVSFGNIAVVWLFVLSDGDDLTVEPDGQIDFPQHFAYQMPQAVSQGVERL